WSDDTLVVNLQGDEPFAPASGIRQVATTLAASGAAMATLAEPVDAAEVLFDPNAVKLVRSAYGDALDLRRAPLPWPRDAFARDRSVLPGGGHWLRHIGIYAYRAGFLRRFAAMPAGVLEQVESLEQLRVLEGGHRIAVALSPEPFPPGVDTPEDLARAEARLRDAGARRPASWSSASATSAARPWPRAHCAPASAPRTWRAGSRSIRPAPAAGTPASRRTDARSPAPAGTGWTSVACVRASCGPATSRTSTGCCAPTPATCATCASWRRRRPATGWRCCWTGPARCPGAKSPTRTTAARSISRKSGAWWTQPRWPRSDVFPTVPAPA